MATRGAFQFDRQELSLDVTEGGLQRALCHLRCTFEHLI
jgi:hypothetical protein